MKPLHQAFLLTFVFIMSMATGCKPNHEPESHLSPELAEQIDYQLAVWIEKRPNDTIAFADCWAPEHEPRYKVLAEGGWIHQYFIDHQTGKHYFLYLKREWRSLYPQDHRAIGGTFELDKQDRIVNMDQVFWSPMLREPELQEKGEILFEELVDTKGNVDKYFGDPAYIEWPNKNVVYLPKENDWLWKPDTLAHKLPKKD